VATGKPHDEPLGHGGWVYELEFSPNGELLASAGSDNRVRLWNVPSGEPHGEWLTGHTDSVSGVAFSPDGELLASASHDKTVRLWEVSSRQPLGQPLTGHTEWVEDVAFAPDGELLASASDDGTVRLWDLEEESLVAEACTTANRNLSKEEWRRFVGSEFGYVHTCSDLPAG
jgi:WD40 repeat protein